MISSSIREVRASVAAALSSSAIGVLAGTGLLIILISVVALGQRISIPDFFAVLDHQRGAQVGENLIIRTFERALFIGYVLACVSIALNLFRRQRVGKQAWRNLGVERLRTEMRGRLLSAMGFMMGELSIKSDKTEVLDSGRLRQAIELCQAGYDNLKGFGSAEYMALNNLVFYLTLQGDKTQRDFVLRKARELREAAEEHDAANLLLTYCAAVLRYSDNSREREEAREITAQYQFDPRLRTEARLYWTGFSQIRSIQVQQSDDSEAEKHG